MPALRPQNLRAGRRPEASGSKSKMAMDGLGVTEPGGFEFWRVLEGLHYYAKLFGFFLKRA